MWGRLKHLLHVLHSVWTVSPLPGNIYSLGVWGVLGPPHHPCSSSGSAPVMWLSLWISRDPTLLLSDAPCVFTSVPCPLSLNLFALSPEISLTTVSQFAGCTLERPAGVAGVGRGWSMSFGWGGCSYHIPGKFAFAKRISFSSPALTSIANAPPSAPPLPAHINPLKNGSGVGACQASRKEAVFAWPPNRRRGGAVVKVPRKTLLHHHRVQRMSLEMTASDAQVTLWVIILSHLKKIFKFIKHCKYFGYDATHSIY